jgi:large subunit ribosomal protein L44e
MAVIPKKRNKYCPKCKKHTEHAVEQTKNKTMGSAHPMSQGSRAQKRHMAASGNNGRYSRPPIGKRRMFGRKNSKKVDLRFKCGTCKKSHRISEGFRARKVEFK